MCKDVVLMLNSMAMEALAKSNFNSCLELLGRADVLTDPERFIRYESLRILTLNNFACCHRR
jgi:hypothetical protein